MKGKIYMQASKVKNIDKNTKNKPTIQFWEKIIKNRTQQDYIHNMVSHTA